MKPRERNKFGNRGGPMHQRDTQVGGVRAARWSCKGLFYLESVHGLPCG